MPQAMLSTTRILVHLVGDGVEVLPLALADGGGVLHLHAAAVGLGLDAQLAGQDLGLLLAAGEAHRDAGVAAGHQHLVVPLDQGEDLLEGLAFGSDHVGTSFRVERAAPGSARAP